MTNEEQPGLSSILNIRLAGAGSTPASVSQGTLSSKDFDRLKQSVSDRMLHSLQQDGDERSPGKRKFSERRPEEDRHDRSRHHDRDRGGSNSTGHSYRSDRDQRPDGGRKGGWREDNRDDDRKGGWKDSKGSYREGSKGGKSSKGGKGGKDRSSTSSAEAQVKVGAKSHQLVKPRTGYLQLSANSREFAEKDLDELLVKNHNYTWDKARKMRHPAGLDLDPGAAFCPCSHKEGHRRADSEFHCFPAGWAEEVRSALPRKYTGDKG